VCAEGEEEAMITYALPGDINYQRALYPDPKIIVPALGLKTYEDVIRHFTSSSLIQDGIGIRDGSLSVMKGIGGYTISFDPDPAQVSAANRFAAMHVKMLDEKHFGLALKGAEACRKTPAWNPMAGYPVAHNGGASVWMPGLPLGMPMINHRAVTLLHYPPIVALQHADYLHNNTLIRWQRLLDRIGVPDVDLYHSILDVNPIAAPGSGESEYPNDFFPINLTSLFFDNDSEGLDYVRSMLELTLDPPANAGSPQTLPLLVCGSPTYDPQAPGWFRTRFKDQLPKDPWTGSPSVNVLQAGFVKIRPDSKKPTPYMIANHMIAASVMGRWTGAPGTPPDIRLYEAQDLAAATFLKICADACAEGQAVDPAEARKTACEQWFGTGDSNDPFNPSKEARTVICALALMDLWTDEFKGYPPILDYDQAAVLCKQPAAANLPWPAQAYMPAPGG
jgi:hypothetical protein